MEINKINKIGNYSPSGHNASSIVDTEGIAPAVMENHGTVTAIVEPKAVSYTRDKDGTVTDRHLNDVFNTIHTGTGGGGNTDCYIAEPMCSVHPLSHAKEFNPETSIKTISPALRATDYKCPHCVYEPREDGVSNTITTVQKDNLLAEPKIIAMRGRNPDNPNERGKSNGKYRQRMEENKDGVSNTLTSVQKDNLVAEPIEVINPLKGKTENGWHYEQQVYDKKGVTRAVKAGGGSGNIPKVIEEPLLIPEATTKGYAEAYDGDSVNLALPSSKTRRGRVGHQQANTLDTSCNQGVVTNYRIRKLTPRECFRLMDVSEPDIDKLLNAGISNSQLYKLAGNSIVVSCLYHIFRKMFIEHQNENQQLTLF